MLRLEPVNGDAGLDEAAVDVCEGFVFDAFIDPAELDAQDAFLRHDAADCRVRAENVTRPATTGPVSKLVFAPESYVQTGCNDATFCVVISLSGE